MTTAEQALGGRSRPRADARRNIQALLDGARTVFARDGVDAPVKDIADASGVGVATLYRHYPKRSDLILAVLQDEVDSCVAVAENLAADHNPTEAVAQWLERHCVFVATKRGLAAALHSDDATFEGLGSRLLVQLEPALARLMRAASDAGEISTYASPMDMLRAVAHLCVPESSDDGFSRRMVALLLMGLRHASD